MDELKVKSLSSKLTELDVAKVGLAIAEGHLSCAKSRYVHAIHLLEEAMEGDLTVLQCQAEVDGYQELYTQALHNAQETAICSWESGLTEGKKEWAQDEWEVRLRTTQTPTVVDVERFIDDVHALRAHSVVSGVKLNKAKAVELHRTAAGGVKGLEVEVSTSCSLRRVEDV